jgi:hypothetical protein
VQEGTNKPCKEVKHEGCRRKKENMGQKEYREERSNDEGVERKGERERVCKK